MRVAALVAEYNPFHCGHREQIRQLREHLGPDTALLVAISSYFCQRGTPALLSPRKRADLALQAGADVVFLLPQFFSAAEGWTFSRAGASLLLDSGLPSLLACGAETQDKISLLALAEAVNLEPDGCKEKLKAGVRSGLSPQQSRVQAYAEAYPDLPVCDLLNHANNRLALGYAAELLSRPETKRPGFFLTRRLGEDEGSLQLKDGVQSSGSGLRAYLSSLPPFERDPSSLFRLQALRQQLPSFSLAALFQAFRDGRLPSEEAFLRRAFFQLLREGSAEKAAVFRYMEHGLAEHLFPLARIQDHERSGLALLEMAKSRNFTAARIRRALFSLLLGLNPETQEACGSKPAFLFPLAFSSRGRWLLKRCPEKSVLPLLGRFSDASALGGAAAAQAELERRAEFLWRDLSGGGQNELLLPPLYRKKAVSSSS